MLNKYVFRIKCICDQKKILQNSSSISYKIPQQSKLSRVCMKNSRLRNMEIVQIKLFITYMQSNAQFWKNVFLRQSFHAHHYITTQGIARYLGRLFSKQYLQRSKNRNYIQLYSSTNITVIFLPKL